MSYYTGIINNANPATSVMDTIRPLIDAHPAWVHIETVTGAATNVADVFKCLGTVNSFGQDFFVIIARSNGTTYGLGIAEGPYDGATKLMSKVGPLAAVGGTVAVAGDYSYATARHVANETTATAATEGFIRLTGGLTDRSRILTASANSPYYLSVTNDRIVWSILYQGNAAPYSMYAGLYDSFHNTTVDPFPLVACHPGSGSYAANEMGAFTREILGGGTPANAFAYSPNRTWTSQPYNGMVGTLPNGREAVTGKYWPMRTVVGSYLNPRAMRGLLKADVVVMAMGDVTENVGDVMTIDGVQYVCVTNYGDSTYYTGTGGGAAAILSSVWVSTAA